MVPIIAVTFVTHYWSITLKGIPAIIVYILTITYMSGKKNLVITYPCTNSVVADTSVVFALRSW